MKNPRNLGIVRACADKSLLCVFLCINFVTKCPSGLVGGGALVHRDVLYMEPCHCPVRVMGRDSYNFAFLRGGTNTAFMPARQREMARGYVSYWCFTLSLPRVHWQNQNFNNKEVQISFRPILKTKWYHVLRLKSKDLILWIHNWLWEWKGFFNFKITQTISINKYTEPFFLFKYLRSFMWSFTHFNVSIYYFICVVLH